ncbi:MAG: hypothetical protein ACP5I8_10855 [Phycisphaerae bacterium]
MRKVGYYFAMRTDVDIVARGPFAATRIAVRYSEANAPDQEICVHIDTQWRQALAAARRAERMLFNNLVAFLKSCKVAAGVLHLELAPTDYKTFLITTQRDRAWFTLHAPTAMTPALGNSILLTHGNTAYLGVRSTTVAAYPRWAHLFGGVLDWPAQRNNGSQALSDHLYRELEEELGISADAFGAPPQALAVLRDPELGQPELVWHGELIAPLELCGKALDAREHDAILAVVLDQSAVTGPPRTPVSTAAINMVRNRRESAGS